MVWGSHFVGSGETSGLTGLSLNGTNGIKHGECCTLIHTYTHVYTHVHTRVQTQKHKELGLQSAF